MTGIRDRRRREVDEQIITLGRAQLAQVGAAALSVRAIARDLGMASSAMYRYVASRDELLTRLVVASYNDLADHVETAVADAAPSERLPVALTAFRAWGVDHPAEFALLYGSPVPGYQAPAGETTAPGTRVIALLLGLLPASTGAVDTAEDGAEMDGALAPELRAIAAEWAPHLDEAGILAALNLWTWLIGAVSQEVFGGYGPDTFAAPSLLFAAQLRAALSGFEL
ncbi:TetR/AcrR family transcriptional regulator [Gordonia phosphorivorans]|uniref:TetR/AcrR family transcriptional regulator n=1 Tax=Gordonia phosphorivorans TaxID=1056982 RepID=A0ABV6H4Q0_9ACTN